VGRDKYFDQREYLLGDSAFSTSAVMIPAFKKSYNCNLSKEKLLSHQAGKGLDPE